MIRRGGVHTQRENFGLLRRRFATRESGPSTPQRFVKRFSAFESRSEEDEFILNGFVRADDLFARTQKGLNRAFFHSVGPPATIARYPRTMAGPDHRGWPFAQGDVPAAPVAHPLHSGSLRKFGCDFRAAQTTHRRGPRATHVRMLLSHRGKTGRSQLL
jgi:hypothetical protein